jgi:hypothetical protein
MTAFGWLLPEQHISLIRENPSSSLLNPCSMRQQLPKNLPLSDPETYTYRYGHARGQACSRTCTPNRRKTPTKHILTALLASAFLMGCGNNGTNHPSYQTIAGKLSVLNGATSAVVQPKMAAPANSQASHALSNGDYALSPSKMTMTVTGFGFIPENGDLNATTMYSISACNATYDRSVGSLALLNSSDISVPIGTFGGLVVKYNVTYAVVMNDSIAGIYSDPDAPNHLTTTAPSGGARAIQVRDQNNTGDDGYSYIYFPSPITISADSTPQIYVVFDPTHWIKAMYNNGTFDAPRMGGNPPIIPSMSSFGKAAFYSNLGTAMSYNWAACGNKACMSLLFLYADAATPVTVTWQDHFVCQASGSWVVAFSGSGTHVGNFGMLGLDASHTLAWAAPGAMASDRQSITAYCGVYRMPEVSTVGQTTVLSYKCTADVPQPASGQNYSSGAPGFAADDTVWLTLLAD